MIIYLRIFGRWGFCLQNNSTETTGSAAERQQKNTKALLRLAESIDRVCGSDIIKNKGWVTINGRHVFIDDGDGGGGGSYSGSSLRTKPLSDSFESFMPVTEATIDSLPKITEFENEELNQAVHNACKQILLDVRDDLPG